MTNKLPVIKRTERGWAGHFICANRCKFRLNTLIEYKDTKIVVSTVGNMFHDDEYMKPEHIGVDRYYETMAFHGVRCEEFIEADVQRQVDFDSEWAIDEPNKDNKASEMHENVVQEIINNIKGIVMRLPVIGKRYKHKRYPGQECLIINITKYRVVYEEVVTTGNVKNGINSYKNSVVWNFLEELPDQEPTI